MVITRGVVMGKTQVDIMNRVWVIQNQMNKLVGSKVLRAFFKVLRTLVGRFTIDVFEVIHMKIATFVETGQPTTRVVT